MSMLPRESGFGDIFSFVKLFLPQNSFSSVSYPMLWLGLNRNSVYWLIFNKSLLYAISNFQYHLTYLNCLLRSQLKHKKIRQSPIATGTQSKLLSDKWINIESTHLQIDKESRFCPSDYSVINWVVFKNKFYFKLYDFLLPLLKYFIHYCFKMRNL